MEQPRGCCSRRAGRSSVTAVNARAKEPARDASGRHVVPLGIRSGGKAWTRVHSAIAAAALDVLCDQGYGAFTVEAVAEAADVNRRTVYRHYPTKIDLAVSSIRQLPTFAGWIDPTQPVHDQVHAAIKHGRPLGNRTARLLATAVTHQQDAPELLDILRAEILEPRVRVFEEWLVAGKAAGWVRPEVTAWDVMTVTVGLQMVDAGALNGPATNKQRNEYWASVMTALVSSDQAVPRPARKKAQAR